MDVLPTRLSGPVLLAPRKFGDARGFFVETFRSTLAEDLGIGEEFVQDNHSRSVRHVVRGMHFQLNPPAGKLVRCARGGVVDVLVDVRPESPTFGDWEAYDLNDENLHMLYAPAGFAHGFCVVTDVADVLYKQTAYWTPDADMAFALDDPDVGIEWPVAPLARIVSERDRDAPRLSEIAAQLAAA